MRIRIDGTSTEIAYALAELRRLLPVASVSEPMATDQPYRWRIYLNTNPARTI
ncbi:hypothetical protein [Acrocarpospora catenulata]|uniref:hypothetical protein n=1 Tax=Acrocarpospora catenulata TaxID=2836182 RepID=UPI001BD934A6|nr:hypothetical protein [Acrocarpospora catenulata]